VALVVVAVGLKEVQLRGRADQPEAARADGSVRAGVPESRRPAEVPIHVDE